MLCMVFCTWNLAIRKAKELLHYAKHTLSKALCEVKGFVKLTREHKLGVCLLAESLSLCSPSASGIKSWMGHGSTAAVLRQPSLMCLTVGVSVRLYACQCPHGYENMQNKSRGAWGSVRQELNILCEKGQPCWSQGNPSRTAVLHSCVWILSQSCFMSLCLCMGLGQGHTGSHKT